MLADWLKMLEMEQYTVAGGISAFSDLILWQILYCWQHSPMYV